MKVAISGVGVAGPTLAYWLARAGHQPTLIEKAPHLRTGGYIIDFWGLGYTIAERMGILPTLREAGYFVEKVRFVDDHGREKGGFSTDVFTRMTDGRFVSVARGDLAATIYRAAEEHAETIFGDSISALEERDGDILVSFAHSAPRAFDLVIGADGLHSNVRSIVFGPEQQFERRLGYHVAAFSLDGYRPREELTYISYALPGRQIARFSQRNDSTLILCVFASEYLRGDEPCDSAGRKAAVREVFTDARWESAEILRAMKDVDDIYFDRMSQIEMPQWSRGRTMLIGDAAACASLLAGEGTGLAMTEAYVLAGELARAGSDYGAAFRNAEKRLRPFITGKQESARNFASAFAPRTQMGIWFRNVVTKLLVFRPLAHYFVGRDLIDDFELPDYGI